MAMQSTPHSSQGSFQSPQQQKGESPSSRLTTTAAPFVPGKISPTSPQASWTPKAQTAGGGESTAGGAAPNSSDTYNKKSFQSPTPTLSATSPSSVGMNSTAAPFIPKQTTSPLVVPRLNLGLTATPTHKERMVQVTRGGCTFFVPESQALIEEGGTATQLNMGLMTQDETLPEWEPSIMVTPRRRTLLSLSMAETLRATYQQQAGLILRQIEPDDERYKEIPAQYYCAYPLDNEAVRRGTAGSFGYPSSVYKVISREDGFPYALRRVENVRSTNEICHAVVETWRNVRHPNVIALHRAFCQHRALFTLRDYHPGAESLQSRLIDKRGLQLLPESLIWSYIAQVASALRTVHGAGLACRIINPAHILLTGHNRVRINGCGLLDIIEHESKKTAVEMQQEDVVSLGKLAISLCCRANVTTSTLNKSIEFIGQHYSTEMMNFVVTMISKPVSIYDVCSAFLTRHLMDELDRMSANCDNLEGELMKECENGRLFKLMVKLGVINERPEYNRDTSWAETGDRYLLKLFRDYVFHQVGEHQEPIIDFGHVVECLNRLDLGDSEKILLSSRDEQSILIASYVDLKKCVDDAFADLCRARNKARASSPMHPGHILPQTPQMMAQYAAGRGRGGVGGRHPSAGRGAVAARGGRGYPR